MDKPSAQKRLKLPPRRNMEARREQNRIASRNYRMPNFLRMHRF